MSDDYDDDVSPGAFPDEDDSVERAACASALQRFFAANFQPGALLSHAWLQEALGVPEPRTANSIEAFRAWQFKFMARLVAFQKTLLLSHNIALANVYGRGYRIVLSNEQSSWALSESTREMRRALSKGVARASHVNLDALTADERRAQSDDLNRIRSLREVLRKEAADARMRARRAGMVGDVQ